MFRAVEFWWVRCILAVAGGPERAPALRYPTRLRGAVWPNRWTAETGSAESPPAHEAPLSEAALAYSPTAPMRVSQALAELEDSDRDHRTRIPVEPVGAVRATAPLPAWRALHLDGPGSGPLLPVAEAQHAG